MAVQSSNLSSHEISPPTLEWNKFREAPYVYQFFLAPNFKGTNDQMTYTMTSHI